MSLGGAFDKVLKQEPPLKEFMGATKGKQVKPRNTLAVKPPPKPVPVKQTKPVRQVYDISIDDADGNIYDVEWEGEAPPTEDQIRTLIAASRKANGVTRVSKGADPVDLPDFVPVKPQKGSVLTNRYSDVKPDPQGVAESIAAGKSIQELWDSYRGNGDSREREAAINELTKRVGDIAARGFGAQGHLAAGYANQFLSLPVEFQTLTSGDKRPLLDQAGALINILSTMIPGADPADAITAGARGIKGMVSAFKAAKVAKGLKSAPEFDLNPVTKFLNDVEASTRPADMSPKPGIGGQVGAPVKESLTTEPPHVKELWRAYERQLNHERDFDAHIKGGGRLEDAPASPVTTVGQVVSDSKIRKQFEDVLDTPVRFEDPTMFPDGDKAPAAFIRSKTGEPSYIAINTAQWNRRSPAQVMEDLVHEMIHAQRARKGRAFENDLPYGERVHEQSATKGAKHFATPTDPPISAQGQGGGREQDIFTRTRAALDANRNGDWSQSVPYKDADNALSVILHGGTYAEPDMRVVIGFTKAMRDVPSESGGSLRQLVQSTLRSRPGRESSSGSLFEHLVGAVERGKISAQDAHDWLIASTPGDFGGIDLERAAKDILKEYGEHQGIGARSDVGGGVSSSTMLGNQEVHAQGRGLVERAVSDGAHRSGSEVPDTVGYGTDRGRKQPQPANVDIPGGGANPRVSRLTPKTQADKRIYDALAADPDADVVFYRSKTKGGNSHDVVSVTWYNKSKGRTNKPAGIPDEYAGARESDLSAEFVRQLKESPTPPQSPDPPQTTVQGARTMYREGSGAELLTNDFINPGSWWTDNPDLAIGQGANKGVLYEFEFSKGAKLVKGGKALPDGAGAEYQVGPGNQQGSSSGRPAGVLKSVTVKPGAQLPQDVALNLQRFSDPNNPNSVWVREDLPDGSTRYTPKAKEQGARTGDTALSAAERHAVYSQSDKALQEWYPSVREAAETGDPKAVALKGLIEERLRSSKHSEDWIKTNLDNTPPSTPEEEALRLSIANAQAQKAAGERVTGKPPVSDAMTAEAPKPKRIISDEALEQARRDLLEGGAFSGLDPKKLKALATIGAYHLESGVRDFAAWSAKMIEDVGEGARKHLKAAWKAAHEEIGEKPPAPKTFAQKAGKAAVVTASNVRGTILGGDIGVLTRQALFTNPINRPAAFFRGLGAGLKSAANPKNLAASEAWLEGRIVNGVLAKEAEDAAGLSRTKWDGGIDEVEELVFAKMIGRLPEKIAGKLEAKGHATAAEWARRLGVPLGAFERFQHAFINTARAVTFDRALKLGYKPEELAQRAAFINNATGRGNIKSVPAALQVIMTSPRYEASRWGMIGEAVRNPYRMAKGALKGEYNRAAAANIQDLTVTAAEVFGLYKLAEAAGYEVEWDPLGTDFLKLRKGNEVWDVTAGMAPRVRDLFRIVYRVGNPEYNKDIGTEMKKAALRSVSPAVKTPITQGSAYWQTKNNPGKLPKDPFNGFELDEEEERGWIAFAPLIYQTWQKTMRETGDTGLAMKATGREFVGQSVNRYPKPKPYR